MKHLLPKLLLSLLPVAASAQSAPAWTKVSTLLTPGVSTVSPVLATDAAGNTYVAGGFTQTIALAAGTTLTSQGSQDGFVAKYDAAGVLLWQQQLAGASNEYFQAIVVDASGNVALLAAASDGTQLGTTTFTASGFGKSVVLALLSPQGQVQSMQELAAGSLLLPQSLARDPAGNYYVSGQFALDATVGTTNLTTPIATTGYAWDQFVTKVSATGTPQWVVQGGRVFITSGRYTPLFPSHLAAGADGVYFNWTCNETTSDFGGLALPTGLGDYDGLAVKLDAQGTPQWAKRLGGAGADVSTNGQLDARGRFVVPGLSTTAGYFSNPANVNNNIVSTGLVTVLEPAAGAPVWTQQLTATSGGSFRDLTSDAAGNLYLTGTFSGRGALGSTTLTGAGGLDAVVVSYAANGTLRWVQQSTGTGDENPGAIALDGSNHLSLVGMVNGNGQFGSLATNSPASSTTQGSPFVARLGSIVTAVRAGQQAAPLALYPNPASAAGTVALPGLPAGTQLTLLDATGRVVRRLPAAPTLPLAGLASGLYAVQAAAPGGEQWSCRLVVE